MTILNINLGPERISVISDTLTVAANGERTPGAWATKVDIAPHLGLMVCGVGWQFLPGCLAEGMGEGWLPAHIEEAAEQAVPFLTRKTAAKLDEFPFMRECMMSLETKVFLLGRSKADCLKGFRLDYSEGAISAAPMRYGVYLHPEVDRRPENPMRTALRQQQVFLDELGHDGAGGLLMEHRLSNEGAHLPELRVRCLGKLDRIAEHREAMGDLSRPLTDEDWISRHHSSENAAC